MSRTALGVVLGFLCSVMSATAGQQPAGNLTIVSSGPVGEVASLAEANEIRVVFSEPMVVLGRIPQPVTAPYVTIRPAMSGSFRWSGTTILIFTPDPARKLPYATEYAVTVSASATAVSGRRLAADHRFTFTSRRCGSSIFSGIGGAPATTVRWSRRCGSISRCARSTFRRIPRFASSRMTGTGRR